MDFRGVSQIKAYPRNYKYRTAQKLDHEYYEKYHNKLENHDNPFVPRMPSLILPDNLLTWLKRN